MALLRWRLPSAKSRVRTAHDEELRKYLGAVLTAVPTSLGTVEVCSIYAPSAIKTLVGDHRIVFKRSIVACVK